jgi:histone acetyltransferase SAS3
MTSTKPQDAAAMLY